MKGLTRTLLVAAVPALTFSLLPRTSVAGAPQEGPGGAQQDDEDGKPDELPGNSDADNFDVFGRRAKPRANTLADRLIGGWRLTRLIIPGSSTAGRKAQGFMHIGPSFLSFELHAIWEGESGQVITENDVHTTYTADYQIEGNGLLYTQTIIGSFIDEDTGALRWERAGFEREYRIREIKQNLELRFTDPGGALGTLVFEPYLPAKRGETDIFGRPAIGSAGARDIFGRPISAHRGERDIFGKPIKPKDAPEEGETDGPPGGDGEKKKGESGLPLRGRDG